MVTHGNMCYRNTSQKGGAGGRGARNRPAARPLHLKITSSESLQSVLTTLRFPGAGDVLQGDSIQGTGRRARGSSR
jgi:hypothetical protein